MSLFLGHVVIKHPESENWDQGVPMVLRKCVFMIIEELHMSSSCSFEGKQRADVTLTVQICASQQFYLL